MSLPIFKMNERIINAATVGAATQSASIDVSEVVNLSLHVIYSGTLSGSASIQGSNDNVNFADVTSTAVISSGAGNVMINIPNIGFRYARANINYTSGSATVSAYMSGKR